MLAQKRGSIVSLASMAGKIGSKTNLPYNASKAAVVSLTKSLALEVAPVRVNLIAAGFVDTPLSASLLGDQIGERSCTPVVLVRLRTSPFSAGTVTISPRNSTARRTPSEVPNSAASAS